MKFKMTSMKVCAAMILGIVNLSSKYANQKNGFIATRKTEKVWTNGATEDEILYEFKIKP